MLFKSKRWEGSNSIEGGTDITADATELLLLLLLLLLASKPSLLLPSPPAPPPAPPPVEFALSVNNTCGVTVKTVL
jgi:hypothetical protein